MGVKLIFIDNEMYMYLCSMYVSLERPFAF
jgi:hypothetical protein